MDNFWDSRVARGIRWRQRWLRTRRLQIVGEPEQKARRGSRYRVAEAQRDLTGQLRDRGQGPLTGPVALDVAFYTNWRQAPGVEKLAKHLLDVLGTVTPGGAERGRRSVLYTDDRQVKLLYVHLRAPGTTTIPAIAEHTALTARPMRDVVADLALVHSTQDESMTTRSTDEDSPLYMPPIPETGPEPVVDLHHATMEEAGQRKTVNDILAAHDHEQLQEALLRRADALLAAAFSGAPTSIAGAREPSRRHADNPRFASAYAMLDEVALNYRQMLMSRLIATPMPGLPRASGEGQAFRNAVRQALEELLVQQPVFAPMCVPLKIILLVVPPLNQGKDLDNLALTVLPAAQNVLRPPAITSYEVIEMKRTPADLPTRYLRLALGSGSQRGSTWQRLTDYVAKHRQQP
jgi:hypothetical protein